MRLPSPIRFFAALALSAAVAGCATPHYQTTVRLIPPGDAQGRACVAACEARKTACQTDCQARYQACSAALEPQVNARHAEALKQYALELRHYAAALRHYELQIQHSSWHDPRFAHPHWMHTFLGFQQPYREPVMPTREGVRAQLAKSNCQEDCGCLPAYDSCFVGCGGQRLSETVCIRNCPPAK